VGEAATSDRSEMSDKPSRKEAKTYTALDSSAAKGVDETIEVGFAKAACWLRQSPGIPSASLVTFVL